MTGADTTLVWLAFVPLRHRWSCSGCSGSATSRTTGSASSRSCGRRAARSTGGRHHRARRRGRLPGRDPARRPARLLLPVAVPHPQGAARRRVGRQDRLRLRARRPARCRRRRRSAASSPATTSRTRAAFLAQRRPARPPARVPARRRLRDQPRAVRRHHRGAASSRARSGTPTRRSTRTGTAQLQAIDGFAPVVIGHGGRSHAAKRGAPRTRRLTSHDTIGVVTVHDGPPIDSGEIIAPEVRPAAGAARPRLLPGPRGLPRARAAGAASSSRC